MAQPQHREDPPVREVFTEDSDIPHVSGEVISYPGADVPYASGSSPDIFFPAVPKSQNEQKGWLARFVSAIQQNGHERRVDGLGQKAIEIAYGVQLGQSVDSHAIQSIGDGMERNEQTVNRYRPNSLAARVTKDLASDGAQRARPRFGATQEFWDTESQNIIRGH
jgi:hypothetical protein